MTTEEDEARAEAERLWPLIDGLHERNRAAGQKQGAFIDGVMWAASRVSTPPSTRDPLNCPGCGYDPMAPHNGKGGCAPATPPTDEDEREALARVVWEESIAFSNPRRPRATEWADVPVSAARQSARQIADAILAAGFRRSVVSTPSDDVRDAIDHIQGAVDFQDAINPEAVKVLVAAVSSPPTITDDEAIAIAFAKSDDMNHEDLCHCRQWPESCVTYGDRRTWTHNAEFVARAALAAALHPGGETNGG